MNNRDRTIEVFKSYLDALSYLKLYDNGKDGNSLLLQENTLSQEEYQTKLEFLHGLQFRRELIEKVESSLESLMSEDEQILRFRYIEELQKDDVMIQMRYKERNYYRKLAKAESLFVQLYDYNY